MLVSEELAALLDAEEEVALVLDRQGVVRHLNAAWCAHAASAKCVLPRAQVLSTPYHQCVTGPLREVVEGCLAQAFADQSKQGVFLYGECNTPEQRRALTTHFSRLESESGEQGLVLRHTLHPLGPLEEDAGEPLGSLRDALGWLLVCGCCRRARVPGSDRWLQRRALLERSFAQVSHGLCPLCAELYYARWLR